MMSKALVFGSMNMDLSVHCPRIPAAGETIGGDSFITTPGGKGANQAVAASRMGASVAMIAAVGADAFGSVLVAGLEEAGVDVSSVHAVSDCLTGTATIIRTDGDNRIILDHGANHRLSFEDVRSAIDAVGEAEDVFLAQFECDPLVTEEALVYAHERGLFTMLNPAPARPVPQRLWDAVDYVCLNETECEIIAGDVPLGHQEAAAAARKIAGCGVGQVVITLGAQGAYGYNCGEECFVPARKVVAVDSTAAGDTFIGAMVAARLLGMSFREAMELATLASAVTVQRVGAQASIPTLEELENLL